MVIISIFHDTFPLLPCFYMTNLCAFLYVLKTFMHASAYGVFPWWFDSVYRLMLDHAFHQQQSPLCSLLPRWAKMTCSTASKIYLQYHNQMLYPLCRRLKSWGLYDLLSTDVARSSGDWDEACSSEWIFPAEWQRISQREEPWRGIRPDRVHSTQQGKKKSQSLTQTGWICTACGRKTDRQGSAVSVTLEFILEYFTVVTLAIQEQ